MMLATRTNEFGHGLGFTLDPSSHHISSHGFNVNSRIAGRPCKIASSKLLYGALSLAVTLDRLIVHLG